MFILDFDRRWKIAHRRKYVFLKKNEEWLEGHVLYSEERAPIQNRGRPIKNFVESSDRSKQRKTEDIRNKYSADELLHAPKMKIRTSGETLEILSNLNASRISNDDALAIFIDAKLTQRQYTIIRNPAPSIYPTKIY